MTVTSISLATLTAAAVLSVAALTDVRSHMIHNRLTYPAMALGLLLAVITSVGIPLAGIRWAESLLGLIGCGGLMLLPYTLSGGGAGDVKLAMAIGSLVGFTPTLQGFCLGYIAAACFVAGRLAVGRLRRRSVEPSIPLVGFFAAGMFAFATMGPIW